MRAGVFRVAGQMPLEDVPDPVAGPRDVVLDVRACGVCGSDLHSFRAGPRNGAQIMGHEFSGAVIDVGNEVDGIAVGDRLTGLPIQPCGECRRCLAGARHLCEVWGTRSIAFGLPGAFAERLHIPAAVLGQNVHKLPEVASFTDGALVEPTAVAVHAVRRAAPQPGQVAVVIGLGPIGLQAGQVLLAAGVTPVIGIDLSPMRRAIGTSLGMITVDGSGSPEVLDAALKEHLGDREVDIVIEASGVGALVPRAIQIVRPQGTVVMVALYHRESPFDPMLAVQREVALLGSANVTPRDFADSLALLGAGRIAMQPLISHRMPLDEISAAFAAQLDPLTSVKVMVTQE